MISDADFDELTANADRYYPPHGEENQRQWWAARGVDYDALTRFCAQDGLDSFENVLPNVAQEHSPVKLSHLLAGGFAMSTEIGFILGWLLCERSRG